MNRKLFCMSLAMACMLGTASASAAFKDIKVDFTGGKIVTPNEKDAIVTFGLAVADDGSVTRVAQDDASSAITVSGKYHSDEHGLGNFSSTVAVDGPVRVSMGTCNWGGDVTIKDAAGNTVGTFNTNDGTCWHDKGNVASAIYRGDATTLTISGGAYTPYFAVEAVDPSDLATAYDVTFTLGDAEGLAPAALSVDEGSTFTVPANFTVFSEGKTLTGWSDGSTTYNIGDEVTVTSNLNLTPVFTANTVSLADRTTELTLRWDFQRQNGAPTVGFEGKDGFWVTQATIGSETIDVKLPFSTSPGKIANANWSDWAQMNNGTTFQVPSCKGATISLEAYSSPNPTVDGEAMTANGTVASFTVLSGADVAELVIGDQGSYYRWIQVILPVVQGSIAGQTFDNVEASVIYAFNSADYMNDITATPNGVFSVTTFDQGANEYKKTISTTMCPNITFVDLNSTNGGSDIMKWAVKPAKGLTFTPTSVSFYIGRDGTDGSENCVTVKGELGDGSVSEVFGSITPHRNNKTQAEDKWGSSASYTTHYEYILTAAQQAALTSGEGFNLVINNGFDASKGVLLSDVQIHGLVNGTVEEVEKFTLSAVANPEEAATISVYPNLDEYDAESVITLTANTKFGYQFVNWTDAAGNVVSDKTKFDFTITANTELTANFNAVKTYELSYSVEGGANSYQVQPTPAPTVVEGKNMYEEGTKVTLTAISNPVMTFTNWSDGQSSSEIAIVMDGDKEISAVFSPSDFIVGWDFYLPGANGRPADFAAADNDAASLVLRNADGNSEGWLDKSEQGAGGYEGRPGGVNWRTYGLGLYYWQTMINAAAFTDLKVQGAMVYNYNAYTTQNVEASLDGETWTLIGAVKIEGAKNWKDYEFAFPAQFNNQEKVYVRWISDTNSQVDGTESQNDGICIGATFITGTPQLINDGTAPVLVSQVPAESDDNASINGRIVLNFDEKVKTAEGTKATLGTLTLEPTVTGKTVMFAYKNLSYATDYTFTLPAGSVMDLTDNALNEAIVIKFTTRTKPEVAKALFDFVVPDDGSLDEAIAAANNRTDATSRFRIFIKNGQYKLAASKDATKTGSDGKAYPDPTTYITKGNISFIGESMDGVVITNTLPDNGSVLEGIGNGDVMRLQPAATNCYFQNLTMKSSMGDSKGRDIVLNDNSDKTIFKDACLWAYQDTYVSNNANATYYFEGGLLRGRTDFLCGKGDVFYQGVTVQMCESGGYITAPSQAKKYGYVFNDCEIVGEKDNVNGSFTLGRPWGQGTPTCYYINTKMTAQPSAIGWNEMSGGYPARFAEYNSTTESGTVIDLSGRKKTFGDNHANNPVLTREEAEAITLSAMMGDWDPTELTEQAPEAENVVFDGTQLTWNDSPYALLWAVCADGQVIGFTTEPSFSVALSRADVIYSVRAANEMGGLGAPVVADSNSLIGNVDTSEVIDTVYYNLQGIRVAANTPGILVKVESLADGSTRTSKIIVK